MVEIKGLEKKFGKQQVLEGVDLKISKGEICAVLGPNGSGKSTLIKCLLGLVIPDKGEILINGKSVLKQHEYRKEIGYMLQIARFPEHLSTKELIAMVTDLRGQRGRDEELIELFKLGPEINKPLGNLSGGTKQKVNATIALMFDSPLLVFDEPTTGLDPVSLVLLKDILRKANENGQTIILISHILSFVEEVADKVIFLQEGKMYFQGGIEELKKSQNEKNLENAIVKMMHGMTHE